MNSRCKIRARAFEMLGGDLFHLDLVVALSRIDVIELPFAARSLVARNARVKRFGDSQDCRINRELQPQIVKPAHCSRSSIAPCLRVSARQPRASRSSTSEPKSKLSRMLPC